MIMTRTIQKRALALIVAAAALIPYLQTGGFDFLNFDDYNYVAYSNVSGGLTWQNVKWAFADVQTMANWHPLTYLSMMTDVSWFGLNPGPMHLVNAVMHAFATGLLFLLLANMPGTPAVAATNPQRRAARALLSAAAAALAWAWHPLRVESVAWISSRKDVLSAVFCLAGLLAHQADIRRWRKETPRETDWRRLLDNAPLGTCSRYAWLGLAAFVLGFMSKPTMMVFPAFIALLEWTEAGRVRWRLLAVYCTGAAIAVGVTICAQGSGGAITAENPFSFRLLNAVRAIGIYMRQTFQPTGLMVFYPYPRHLPPVAVANGLACTAGLLILAQACWKALPAVTSGILWFFVALVPVIGLVQVGSAGHADRYTYLSQIGFAIALAVVLDRLQARSRAWQHAARAAAALALAALLALAWRQTGRWRNDPTMFTYMLRVDPGNDLANRNFGLHAYGTYRDYPAAIEHLSKYLQRARGHHFAERSLYILILAEAGRLDEARLEASRLSNDVNTHLKKSELGTFIAYAAIAYFEGDRDLAQRHAAFVLERVPRHPDANYLLGLIAHDEGRIEDAIAFWTAAHKGDLPYQFLKPRIAEARRLLESKKAPPEP